MPRSPQKKGSAGSPPLTFEYHYTPDEVAARLQVSVERLEKWRRTGAGPPYRKFGRFVRYPAKKLDVWLESRDRAHTSDPGPSTANILPFPGERRD